MLWHIVEGGPRYSEGSRETNVKAGTLIETYADDGFSHTHVASEPRITRTADHLSGTENVSIFCASDPVIAAAAEDGDPDLLGESHSDSGGGCLPENVEVVLKKRAGGDLGIFLVALGNGTRHSKHHCGSGRSLECQQSDSVRSEVGTIF